MSKKTPNKPRNTRTRPGVAGRTVQDKSRNKSGMTNKLNNGSKKNSLQNKNFGASLSGLFSKKGWDKNIQNLKSKRLPNSKRGGLKSKRSLASGVPEGRFKKILWYSHPKRFFKFLFSKEGFFFSLKAIGIGVLMFGLMMFGLFAYYRKDLNKLKPEQIAARIQSSGVKYYDRTGQVLLWEQKDQKDRTVVESDGIAEHLKHATVALEDRNFENHRGFDVKGILRAVFKNSTNSGTQQGGSTITQQLVKNELLTNERSLSRKIKELILAIEVERTYSKDQILTLYLNSNNYGGTATGIERAAQRYFGDSKHAVDLTVEESLFLAAIPQSPSRYDPYRSSFKPDLLKSRMKSGLAAMVEMGFITQEEADVVDTDGILDKIQPRELALKGQYDGIRAPHFVLEVEKELQDKFSDKELVSSGYKVITTLDWDMQQIADKSVADAMPKIDSGGGDNVALVSVDVQTGQVLAYVGSRDFNYPVYGQGNEAREPRQPGSSLKPFVYAKLFESDKWGPGSTILDTPKTWPEYNNYTPGNVDNQFWGPVSIRVALSNSRNLPALRAIDEVGVEETVQFAKSMGDESLCDLTKEAGKSYGIAVILGGCELRLEEHVQAYSSFARKGVNKPQSKILRVEEPRGGIAYEWTDTPGEQIVNEEVAWLVNDVLSDDGARSRLFGANNRNLVVPGIKTALKTGTTNRRAEAWMMGYTPKISTGVLVDRNDHQGMTALSTNLTGPVYTNFMKDVYKLKGWQSEDFFERPAGIQRLSVDGREDWFPSWFKKPKELPGREFIVDSISKKLATNCTPETARVAIQARAIQTGESETDIQYLADGYDLVNSDDVHRCEDVRPNASISSTVTATPGTYNIKITLSQGTHALQSAEYYVDGSLVQNLSATPGVVTISQNLSAGQHTLKVIVRDQALYQKESAITVNVVASGGGGGNGGGNGGGGIVPPIP